MRCFYSISCSDSNLFAQHQDFSAVGEVSPRWIPHCWIMTTEALAGNHCPSNQTLIRIEFGCTFNMVISLPQWDNEGFLFARRKLLLIVLPFDKYGFQAYACSWNDRHLIPVSSRTNASMHGLKCVSVVMCYRISNWTKWQNFQSWFLCSERVWINQKVLI